MKIIRSLFCVVCIISLVSCCSCKLFVRKEYHCTADEVKSIQIVKLGEYVEGECRHEYTVLSQISDHKSFVERLNKVECSVNRGDPQVFFVGDIVIKIDYYNGDYDLVHENSQWFVRSGKIRTGYFVFDRKQFIKLISAYNT